MAVSGVSHTEESPSPPIGIKGRYTELTNRAYCWRCRSGYRLNWREEDDQSRQHGGSFLLQLVVAVF